MYGTDVLMTEHATIIRYTDCISKYCCELLEGKEPDVDRLREYADFGRHFADAYHHGKEEIILFRIMTEKLGDTAKRLIQNGMLVEHDLGRYHVRELLQAIDAYQNAPSTQTKLPILTHLTGYADLLKRHAAKEDDVAYPYALRTLSEDDLKQVDSETEAFEKRPENCKLRDTYLHWLSREEASLTTSSSRYILSAHS